MEIPNKELLGEQRQHSADQPVKAKAAPTDTNAQANHERLQTLAKKNQLNLADWIEITGLKIDLDGENTRYKITCDGVQFAAWPEGMVSEAPALWQAEMSRDNDAPVLTFPCTPNELVDFVDADPAGLGSLSVPDSFRDAVTAPLTTVEQSPEKPAADHEAAAAGAPQRDITEERGCRRLIRENWGDIRSLHGVDADGRQVRNLLKRRVEPSELPALKTIQNCLIVLRKENLIP